MRYTPNFCCNCGERIERLNWPLWSGKRFCQLCETDFWIFDAAPKLAVAVVALLGLLGFATFLRTPVESPNRVATQSFLQQTSAAAVPAASAQPSLSRSGSATDVNSTAPSHPPDKTSVAHQNREPSSGTFHCAAMTRKGTPCSRRVKAAGNRCWQHKGMLGASESTGTPGLTN